MLGSKWFKLAVVCAAVLFYLSWPGMGEVTVADKNDEMVQAQVILAVSESKRLIAKGVARHPMIEAALADGMVIICKGTTNTYVAEEITGGKIEHGAYVYGRVYPAKSGKRLNPATTIKEIVLVKGKRAEISLADAVKQLKPGDVVIKGANVLDYDSKVAGVFTGGGGGGTTGTVWPYVVARKVNLVIPVGLEKQVAGSPVDISNMLREPVKSLNSIPSMFLLTGNIVTEIEAIKAFADVEIYQVGAGGIGGAEGAVRLLIRGAKDQVERALKIAEGVQGEPAFVE